MPREKEEEKKIIKTVFEAVKISCSKMEQLANKKEPKMVPPKERNFKVSYDVLQSEVGLGRKDVPNSLGFYNKLKYVLSNHQDVLVELLRTILSFEVDKSDPVVMVKNIGIPSSDWKTMEVHFIFNEKIMVRIQD